MITVKIELDVGDDAEDMEFEELSELIQDAFACFNWSATLKSFTRDE